MLFGDHEIEGELGHGAMGRVLRARHRPTGAARAIKILTGSLDPEAVVRFRREAEALARLDGRGVVVVHETGLARGQLYMAMDLMIGGSLRARLRSRGALESTEALTIAAKLARTLERCHALGIIHRDVKPENILFDDRDEPRLADFGVARNLDASQLTQTGVDPGTYGYMAPELERGEKATPRTDVFALGVVLHEMLTGAIPGAAGAPPPPPALARLLGQAVAPDPQARFADAATFARALEQSLAREPSAKTNGKSRARVAIVIAIVVAIGLVGVGALVGARTTSPSSPTSEPRPSARPRAPKPRASPTGEPATAGTPSPHELEVLQQQALKSIADDVADDASATVFQRGPRAGKDVVALAGQAARRARDEAAKSLAAAAPTNLESAAVVHALEADAFAEMAEILGAGSSETARSAESETAAGRVIEALAPVDHPLDLRTYRLLRRASLGDARFEAALGNIAERIVVKEKRIPLARGRADLQRLLVLHPLVADASVSYAMGRLHLAFDDTVPRDSVLAEEYLRAINETEPGFPYGAYWVRHWLASALHDNGKTHEALKVLVRAEGEMPRDVRVAELAGLLALVDGDETQARAYFYTGFDKIEPPLRPEVARALETWRNALEPGHAGEIVPILEAEHLRDERGEPP